MTEPSAAAVSLLSPRPPVAPPTQGSPAQSAVEALIASHIGGALEKPSNPSELAAAGGDRPAESTSKWTDADLQAARAYLGRFQAPPSILGQSKLSDEYVQWGLGLAEMQKGINAKTKAQAERIAELEQHLTKLAAGAGKAPSEGRKPKDTAGDAALKEFAEELGADASKIGPALERLLEARFPKQEPTSPQGDDELKREVRALAVGSARTQLQGMYPGLQHDALYTEILDDMQSLNGPRWNDLPRGERELAKMQYACKARFGDPSSSVGPDKTQTRDQRLRSQVPTPQSGQRDPTPKAGVDLARDLIARLGSA